MNILVSAKIDIAKTYFSSTNGISLKCAKIINYMFFIVWELSIFDPAPEKSNHNSGVESWEDIPATSSVALPQHSALSTQHSALSIQHSALIHPYVFVINVFVFDIALNFSFAFILFLVPN